MPSSTTRPRTDRIANELSLAKERVSAVLKLLEEDATVPFIARYRKEVTGGLDEQAIADIRERRAFHKEMDERRDTILKSIEEQGKLSDELRGAIEAAMTRSALEDLYLPYKPKRRTRATIAKERGLEPLADRMWAQEETGGDIASIAAQFVDAEKDVADVEQALAGARDILAERMVEQAPWRDEIRQLTTREGVLTSKAARGKKDERSKFEDYYDFQQAVRDIPGHRILAIRRGEKEGFLSYHITPDPDKAKGMLQRRAVRNANSIWAEQLRFAAADAYDRLLSAQIETELRMELRRRAEGGAIDVFAKNLRELLLAAPFGARPLLAIDPGFRTGCKVVVLDATGRLLDEGVIYPTEPRRDIEGTRKALDRWLDRHPIEAIAIGNGTGGRETFDLVRKYLRERGGEVAAVLVNESGASIYSASDIAREEFPDKDITVRGAVSIGRRLQDPLSELVKLDPGSIGVGQYQHDVDGRLLKERLSEVVVSCVNHVGVDLNTASPSLLSHVSGLGSKQAKAIVSHRESKGAFGSRADLLGVAGLGPKTYELAAGFLRVRGINPLDNSAVHPERYDLVADMAADLGVSVADLIGHESRIQAIEFSKYEDESVGRYTLEDILAELGKPGRDPREHFEAIAYDDNVHDIKDLREDMVLEGVVTNVTNFGAFVDVGVHQDGLVHVSQIAHRFVKDPADELRVGQKVRVRVMDVDLQRRRIGLSIKAVEG